MSKITLEKNKLHVPCPKEKHLWMQAGVACRHLPSCYYHRGANRWVIVATPLAAHYLIDRLSNSQFNYDVSHDVESLAQEWDARDSKSLVEPRSLTELWQHQVDAYNYAFNRPATMLGMEMGCGKSLTAIALVTAWNCDRVLVLCPKAVVNVWPREFRKHCHPDYRYRICAPIRGTAARKAQQVKNFLHATQDSVARVLVVNYETARRPTMQDLLLATDWDCIIADESHKLKSPTGVTSKFAYKLGQGVPRKLALTGTPLPHSPLDAFGQYRFLEPALYGTSYTRFRSQYARCDPMFPGKVLQWLNQDDLSAKMNQLTYRVKAADVLDLPEKIVDHVDIDLSPKAQRIHDKLKAEAIVQIADGELTVSNALVKLLRLRQITGGWARDDEEYYHRVDHAKQEALTELLEDVEEPVVVFATFTRDLRVIQDVAEGMGRRYGELSGSCNDLTDDAEYPEHVDVLGVQEQAGGLGIDLTRSRLGIFYSLGYSLGDHDQCVARLHRPGQTKTTWLYYLVAKGTVEPQVYKALRDRRDVVEYVLETLKQGDER